MRKIPNRLLVTDAWCPVTLRTAMTVSLIAAGWVGQQYGRLARPR